MAHPVTGPVPPEVFAGLASAPFGEAARMIRKFDPTWGLKEGETIKWLVRFEREVTEIGFATVEAGTREEAEAIAAALDEGKITSDDIESYERWGVAQVEPAPGSRRHEP